MVKSFQSVHSINFDTSALFEQLNWPQDPNYFNIVILVNLTFYFQFPTYVKY